MPTTTAWNSNQVINGVTDIHKAFQEHHSDNLAGAFKAMVTNLGLEIPTSKGLLEEKTNAHSIRWNVFMGDSVGGGRNERTALSKAIKELPVLAADFRKLGVVDVFRLTVKVI
ncbi:hypothetical protein [Shimia abyssi]|uniref:Uncharacterized protein n=1 Tax=Shimia abyssi TaxID=1662395 RepID=A0A2P8F996_9RHOB|nr:hypothetical protein [Shimia abyssi]PSL18301.1 hypothetical protein CLV88_11146 [Shimia abyssi]